MRDHSIPWRHLRLAAVILIVARLDCGVACAQARTARIASSKNETIPAAAAKDIGQDWVRMKYDSDGEPIAMQTAIVRYSRENPKGNVGARQITVDLIGAVHIGD